MLPRSLPRRPRWVMSRLRRSSLVWWTATFVAAGVTAVLVQGLLARATAAAARYGSPRMVIVVQRAVPAGAVVEPGWVAAEPVPAALVPHGALDDPADAVGRVARTDLVPGEVLVARRLAPDGLTGAAALVPEGARAIAVPDGPGGRPPVRVGDRVDAYATTEDGRAVTVAEAAVVVAVDERAQTVTVAVPLADAPRLAAAIATTAVTLALAGG